MRIAYFTESLPPLIDGVTRTLTQLAQTLEEVCSLSGGSTNASVPLFVSLSARNLLTPKKILLDYSDTVSVVR
jgi:hypothetical protein